jgi:hypothetical protein
MFDAINQLHPNHKPADGLFKQPEYKLINDRVVKFLDVKVHEFTMGDVEDPDLYAAQPLHEWQQSEEGQWVMEHAVETPFWHRHIDPYDYGYKYYVIARLKEQDQIYWTLKWQKKS